MIFNIMSLLVDSSTVFLRSTRHQHHNIVLVVLITRPVSQVGNIFVNSVLFYAGSSKEFTLGKLNVKKNTI